MNQKEVPPSILHLRLEKSLNGNSGLLRQSPIMMRLLFSAVFLICCASQADARNTALAATLDFNKYANLYEVCSFGKSGFQDISESADMLRLTFEHHESTPDMPSDIDKLNWFSEGTQFPVNDKIAEPMAMYSKLSNHWRKCFLFRTEDADLARLQSQTGLMFGMGLVAAGILAAMPESVSKWDMEGVTAGYMLEKWWDNVSSGPVWDQDEWYMNYIGHTYDGGVYYQIARNSGYSQWDSFVYTTLMSTFFWEYGFEAFAEVPSIQDLIVTPVGGWLYGEWAYKTENAIKSNDYRVLGTRWLGYVSVFLLDPINYIAEGINLVAGREWIITGSFAVIGPSGRDNPNVIGPISISPQMHLSFHRDF
jgi:hypothetical protein